ncbi:two-component response regulator-like PRR73 isoform X2 [Lactuca sativa]|uniref:Uncharacterized protein n=1 Tax=Lactuca sativa TaxID=4236 RepID=A0A9R1WXR9_LACSA|nr:two-component response regulator-like PRR73 isoform X2 [Lactuca sativa]KAJ0190509.1 hypothetical protein LSAT_V11C800396460 [Lactuca sativa]
MRSITVNTNVPATKGLAELNHHHRDELKQVRNGAGFDGQGLSEEDESRINEDVNSGRQNQKNLVHVHPPHDALHRQHQQHQGSMVEWERFLPLRSLKVLLVENDDSTRHVVSALLRNCSYEVTAVANGVEAWKVLIDQNKQIDIVLTEVLMPYLSGIGLLSKIMNHVTRKNVPVIMMSSDDSMGIVFNCLSKGAVDFLVKPIRKNELKNLWQHVWRKCHSSSGSGSESGIRTRKSSAKSITKNKHDDDNDDEEDDDEDDSHTSDDDVSMDLTAKGGSDNGSGTQSSWSKRAVEVNSSQAQSVWDKLQDPRVRKEHVTQEDKLETVEMGKDLEIGVPNSSSFEVEDAKKKSMSKFSGSNLKKVGDDLDISMKIGCENGPTKMTMTNVQNEALPKATQLLKNINIENNNTNINNNNKSVYYSKESPPTLELSLKRPRDVEDADADAGGEDRNVLRHSGVSAFSRYNTNTVSNVNQAQTGIVGSCSPLGISSEAVNADNINSNSNGNRNQPSNGSDDMGSTTNNAFPTKPDDKPVPNANGSTIQAVHLTSTTNLQPLEPCTDGDNTKAAGQQVQVRHHHHHYHHHHHHVHKLQQQKMVDPDMVSNILTVSAEGNAANFGSASGSNNNDNNNNININKSNGEMEKGGGWQQGKTAAPVVDNGVAGKCNGGDGSGSGSGSARGSGVDQDRLAQREAALNKFRQKRKERCFEKKVRYQSRKRLAEQRPRVRGQFVRHGANGVNNEDADS